MISPAQTTWPHNKLFQFGHLGPWPKWPKEKHLQQEEKAKTLQKSSNCFLKIWSIQVCGSHQDLTLMWVERKEKTKTGPWCFLCATKALPSLDVPADLFPPLFVTWLFFVVFLTPACDFNPASLGTSASAESPWHLQRLSEYWCIQYIINTLFTSPLIFFFFLCWGAYSSYGS